MRLASMLAVMLLVLPAIPAAAARHHAANHRAAANGGSAATKPAPTQEMLSEQLLLARAGFSPGVIDGRGGDNTENALHAFQQANGLPVGKLDPETAAKLSQGGGGPLYAEYTIQPADVAGPFTPQIPKDFTAMAQLPRLSYRSSRQLLAEKFHTSEQLLSALNPGKDLAQAGTVITVPDLGGQPQTASAQSPNTGSSAAASAALVVVDKQHRAVLVYGADKRLIAFYPASIGSTEKPAPSGTFQVRDIAHNPTYTYNPAYGFKGQSATQPVKVPPGPNNPVGEVWIGLSLKGYGIHGTPDPDKVGKTQSHGCIRLTNWDALALAKLVKKGTPVDFIG